MSKKKQNATQGGKSRSLLVPLLLLISVAACSAAGYLFWQMKSAKPVTEEAEQAEVVQPAVEINPLYLSLNTFTVSLKPTSDEADRVLFIGMSVRVADQPSLLLLEKYLPEYRSRLFMLLTQQTYEALSTDEGKTQLIASLKEEMAKPIGKNLAVKPTDILINEFILR